MNRLPVVIVAAGLLLSVPIAATSRQAQVVDLAEATRGLQQATREYNEGQLPNAIATLTTVVDKLQGSHSTDSAAREVYLKAIFLRGRAHLLQNDGESAKSDFHTLLTIKPDYTVDAGVATKIQQAFSDVRAATIGTLTLHVSPGDAQVRLDSDSTGPVQGAVSVVAGPHTLVVTRPGFKPSTESLNVLAGTTTERRIELERVSAVARLITAPSGVDVRINGRSQGVTEPGPPGEKWNSRFPQGHRASEFSSEFLLSDLAVGTVEVSFQKPCHVSRAERWTIPSLADFPTDPVVLEKAIGNLRIERPVGAAVIIDDVPQGAIPVSLELCEGEHRFDIRAPGVRDIRTLTVSAGQSSTLVPRLRPVVAILDVVRSATGGVPASGAGDVGPDLRLEMERRLSTENTLFWAPPLSLAASARGSAARDGWLSYSLEREPVGDIAQGLSPTHVRELSVHLTKALDVQAVAEMRPRSTLARDQSGYLLSILAQGSTVPDVVDVDLGSGQSVSRAIAALDAVPTFYRASVGLGVVDVIGLKGPVVAVGSPAGKAEVGGISAGDVIERINGQAVPDAHSFSQLLASKKPGEMLTVDYRDRTGAAHSAKLPVMRVACTISTNDESWLPNLLVASLRSILMSDPDPVVRLNLAVALMRLKNPEAALEELTHIDLPLGPGVSTGTVQFLIGECYAQLGITARAREAWQAAAATDHLLTQDGPPVRDLVTARLATLERTGS